MLDSAQLCQSVLPTGAWSADRVPMKWSKTIDGAAAAWFFEPSIATVGDQYFKYNTIPLWNPWQAYGSPFAANMQSQPFFPLTVLLSLHLTPSTYNLFILCRLLIAGAFGWLYFRLFVSFAAAMAGAISTMLGGYYLLYMTMPHLSVEMLIPAAIFAAECMLRSRGYASFVFFVLIALLSILGGMPESTLLLMCFVYGYLGWRILSDAHLRHVWVRVVSRITLAGVAALGLGAPLLLPFLEYLKLSYNTHDPSHGGHFAGLYHFTPGADMLSFVLPLIEGQWHNLTNDVGLVVLFLAMVAVLAVCSSEGWKRAAVRNVTLFFAGYGTLLLLKIYGVYPINALGSLPLFRVVDIYKYGQPVLSFCFAGLAAFGLEQLINWPTGRGKIILALLLAGATIPLAAVFCRPVIAAQLALHGTDPAFEHWALGTGAGALVFLLGSLLLVWPRQPLFGIAILVLLTAELCFNYVVPLYYVYNRMPLQSQNPYAGAPYIDFLRSINGKGDRIFAHDRILYPNWASVFEIPDIRDLDAMYYWKYLRFVHQFRDSGSAVAGSPELTDRFTGDEKGYPFTSERQKRLLELSSVKYLVSSSPLIDPRFKSIYLGEVRIYQNDQSLPRASLFFKTRLVADGEQALRTLSESDVPLGDTIVLDRQSLSLSEVAAAEELNNNVGSGIGSAEIESYTPRAVMIRAKLDRPGILMLNDSDYPGWTVQVDGAKMTWFTADYMFRGVMLAAGEHVVRFTYRPHSFYAGAALCAVTLLLLGYGGVRQGSAGSPLS